MKNQFLAAAIALVAITKIGYGEATEAVGPDNSQFDYAGYINKELVTPTDASLGQVVRFDRELEMDGKGYRWNNPGTTIRFRTDASEIVAVFNYTDLHTSKTARSSMGVYSVDGEFKRQWCFQPKQRTAERAPEVVFAPIQNGGVAGFHDYAIYLPYGDSVDFGGLKVNAGAQFEPVKSRPTIRYLAYGDSVTHGFSASEVSKTYPFLLARQKGWQAINLGLGGRAIIPSDAKVIAAAKPDIITVMMGANNWQGGTPLNVYRARMEEFIASLRAELPGTPIYFLTSLWVNPSWNPAAKVASLEEYRQVLREVVAAQNDSNCVIVEGPSLIDEVPALFDATPVHPNDRGFAMMADRLGQQIKDVPPAK